MLAPVLEATDIASVVLPTPGNPQKRISTGITDSMSSVNSIEKSISPLSRSVSENELVLRRPPTYSYHPEICS